MKTLNVLIVEDDIVTATIATELCVALGAKVKAVQNGLEAIELYQNTKEPFDLILMDLEMPLMGGFEATYEIRQYEIEQGSEPVPIVAVSGFVESNTLHKCLKSGMNQCAHKPYTANMIKGVFEAHIPHHNLSQAFEARSRVGNL